ncbi:hypothetical protein Q757_09405 [Oenococcus alcoholitolerans]|uniref:Uncharacterized protein n=1 Tax=Oenococcus alcoholitolerans TaxID=931074 RepID=A0ABR4XNV9_9LACO|nr:hypothetical protein Q757_09405 [Oenococcus alcoholitolerans]
MENTSKTVEYREVKNGKQSFFDGGLAQFIGYLILGIIVTCITFGICYPWSFTMIYNWQINTLL